MTRIPKGVPPVDQQYECLDGNEAAARVAYALSEVISIYPITPASGMAEHCDDWSAAGRPNLWGAVPDVVEMQSEAGAAGALHGALQKGALGTTFTASQGLLLMVPNMFKIAGELTPTVIHVAARTIATHALSIFGDHSDVMHARTTGWAMLAAGSVQEAHDFALVAHAATLRSRIPFLHFFDGFRTSHEINKIAVLEADDMRALVRDEDVLAFRNRGLTPDAPLVRGTAQNPDVFFQAREASNPYHLAVPGIVQEVMDELAARTGRQYGLVEYHGAPDADRVIVVMGSASGAVEETVDTLIATGERVGMLRIRLFQPFPADEILAALPPTVRAIAVLDRTKEPGAIGEPLYLEVVAALAEAMDRDAPPFETIPRVIGGRYGLSSKEMTPSMIKPIFDELAAARPKRHFTVGIYDDVTHLSLPIDTAFQRPRPAGEVQAMFFGLGSDGTVGANKASIKIIGESTDLYAQGYYVLDSKKSGSVTVSHLRFGPEPIRSTYLIDGADFVACHQFGLLGKMKVLEFAKHGATFLLNAPYGPDEVWEHLPGGVQQLILEKEIDFWVIDAIKVADEAGMGGRINTVMQPCFFQLAGILPPDEAIAKIKGFVEKTYAKRGTAIVERNFAAIDQSLAHLGHVPLGGVTNDRGTTAPMLEHVPDFVTRITARLMAGDGDQLPVSALPVDGSFPSGTTKYEKRAIAQMIPIWDPAICIDCGKCAMVCPHATIRMKVFPTAAVEAAPGGFLHKEFRSRDLPEHRLTIQVAPDDCTGCGVCVDVCPAKSKTDTSHKAINMEPVADHRDVERVRWDFFQSIPPLDRSLIAHDTVKGSQVLEPLFEFSGACGGCGETPYIRLVSQLFGDRMIVANATGCSSIYGANLPTTPWTVDAVGRGPAWANSLFEDNAEFGLGMRLALDAQTDHARRLLERLAPALGPDLVTGILEAVQDTEVDIGLQRERVGRLREALARGRRPAGLGRSAPARARGRPRPQGHLDHRRRRLGLRHRLRWRRPGPLVRAQRQHPRPRHRGLFQYRRPGFEGNAARRRREVRRGRQRHGQEGPRGDRPLVWQRLRRPGLDGRERPPDDQGAARGRRLAGSVARHRVQHLHRARDRHVEVDEPPEGRRQERLLAAVPVPPVRDRRREAVQAGLRDAVDPDRRLRGDRDALRRPAADASGTSRRARGTGPGRRRRTVALLRAAGRHRADRSAPPRAGSGDRARGRERRGLPLRGRREREMTVDLRTRYLGLDLRSPIVASAAPQNGEPAMAGRLERAGAGAIVLPSLFEEEILAEELELNRSLEQGTEAFVEALDYFPAVDRFVGAADRYLASLERVKAAAGVPIIASLEREQPRRLGPVCATHPGRRRGRAGAEPVPRRRRPAADGGGHRRQPTWNSSRPSAPRSTIPLAIKLSPYYSRSRTSPRRRSRAGADGLVLFNRFYQPDLDLDALEVVPRARAEPALGDAAAGPLDRDPAAAARSRRFARGDIRRPHRDRRGQGPDGRCRRRDDDLGPPAPRPGAHRTVVEAELRAWMTEHEYVSVDQLRGSASQATAEDPSAFERANYMQTLRSWVAPEALTATAPSSSAGRGQS